MSWTRAGNFRTQIEKLWERGDMLASLVTGELLFPRRLILRCPTSGEMADRFDEVRAWVGEVRAVPHCRIEMREFKHRVFGANSVPAEVWIDSFDDAVALAAKRREVSCFTSLLNATRQRQPKLLEWLAKRPMRALALADEWSRLLEIVAWMQVHPKPDVYLRQVDIPGVHSKFIETHRSVLAELFDMALPPEAIDVSASGVNGFATRYGFRDKPLRIRFRFLDPNLIPSVPGQDITLDAASFAQLDPMVSQVFIVENEINFLSFPQLKDSLVIFGSGYGFEMLSQSRWLSRCCIHYWGDIDTHGFAILDQLRNQFAHVESLLMDRATLLEFELHWGEEEKQTLRGLSKLNAEEVTVYNDLRDNRIRKNLRLEQEKIGFGWIEAALKKLSDSR